jgi:hypothetical protein
MNTYTAKLDNGEGGETELQAKTAQEALAMAMAWAAKGDWSDPNPNHLGGVLVRMRQGIFRNRKPPDRAGRNMELTYQDFDTLAEYEEYIEELANAECDDDDIDPEAP